jgi:trimeric autotransporter adhesin
MLLRNENRITMLHGTLLLAACAVSLAVCSSAQTQIVDTVAGGGAPGLAATAYSASGASAVALDASGNLYVAASALNQIWVVSPSGAVMEVIGNGSPSYSGDGGSAISAGLNGPSGVAVDSSGNLYIADAKNNRIRKVTAATGAITTVAGTGVTGFSGDMGPATSAQLYEPWGVALDANGNLYIADKLNMVIRRVDAATGIINIVAGDVALTIFSGGFPFGSYSGDGGPATIAGLDQPTSVAVDAAGNLYIADSVFDVIRKVSVATGVITTVAGIGHPTGLTASNGDGGPAASASVDVSGIALDSLGNIYIAGIGVVRKVTAATGIITTLAGTYSIYTSGDGGAATSAAVGGPSGVAVDSAGNVYLADPGSGTVRKVTASTGIITAVAGNYATSYSGDGGPAINAQLHIPRGVAVDRSGSLYIADTLNGLIRKVAADIGIIGTVAGHYNPYSPLQTADGIPSTEASLNQPSGIAVDSSGNLYVTDAARVRQINAATGVITTVAGNLTVSQPGGFPQGYSGDGGPATSAKLNNPAGLALDAGGNLYIADTYNSVIRMVTAATGIITTVAGSGPGYTGDGGPATRAGLKMPTGVAVDSACNMFIADQGNNTIRKVTAATGIITTVAGNGVQGYGGDGGPAVLAQVNQPSGVAVDSVGNLYIADQGNSAVRKVTLATGVITTIAGNGSVGFRGDGGPASAAQLANPFGVATGPGGRVYVSDTMNNRIRALPMPAVSPLPLVSPSFAGTPSVSAGGMAVLTYSITNPASGQAAAGLNFNSALSPGLLVTGPAGQSGSCGTMAAVPGSRAVTVSGVELAPGGTCTASVNVAAAGLGPQFATVADLVSGGTPANFLGLASINVEGVAAVVDSASFITRTVTPNQILSYFGPVGCSPNEQVLVNGQAAGILFGNAAQINFVSPESVAGDPVTIQLMCNGTATVTLTAPEAAASPSLFTETGTGTGQGSIVNSDGTVNSPANPIARGSYISVYGTGFGPLNPAGADGLRHLAAAVTATIGGANATVLYAGEAPEETIGLQQINLVVPAGISPGPNAPIILTVNGASTQARVTVAVK